MPIKTSTVLIALLATLLLSLAPVPAGAAAPGFTTPVQVTSATGTDDQVYPQIAVDSSGHTHIVWQGLDPASAGGVQIFYADDVSGNWVVTRLTNAGPGNDQSSPYVAVDSNLKSHVAWFGEDPVAGGPYQVWYADNTSGTWVTTALTSADANQWLCRLAVDPNGRSHVSWQGAIPGVGGPDQVWCADNTSGAWVTSQITNASSGNSQNSAEVAADPSGTTHVTWVGPDPVAGGVSQVWYADNASGPWATSRISSAVADQFWARIAVDGNGGSHLTWMGYSAGSSPYQIWHADDTTGVWSVTRLTDSTVDQIYPDITVDGNNRSHIAWQGLYPVTDGAYQIYCADNTGGAWNTSRLTNAAKDNHQWWPAIASDSNGKSHVTWFGPDPVTGLPYQVWYADDCAGGWNISRITNAADGNPQYFPQIALGADGRSHMAWNGLNPVSGNPSQIWYSGAVGPSVTGISPASGTTQDNALQVTVTGSGFLPGASLRLTGPAAIGPIATAGSGSSLHTVLDLTDMPTGAYDVTVTNPDLISASLAGAFTVNPSGNVWYLAEGTTAWGFSTFVNIESPNDTELTARITCMDTAGGSASGKGVILQKDIQLPAASQTLLNMADILPYPSDFSTRIECLEGKEIEVDRTMVWTGGDPAGEEGHSSIGVTSPSKTWYLPEGSSNWGFETWTLVQNPGANDANVTLNYMTEGQGARSITRVVPAYSRVSFSMAADIGQADSSIEVASDQAVIAERSMYRNGRREGSCSIGATAASQHFFLAEGTTAWGFTTYVLIQNPDADPAEVTLTCQTPAGPVTLPSFVLAGDSRRTVRLNDIPEAANRDLSVEVSSTKPVVAERAMYWSTPTGEVCHDSIGVSAAHMRFYLPEGQTSRGRETWTLVANPNGQEVHVGVVYLSLDGKEDLIFFSDTIAPGMRKSYKMNDRLPDGRASIAVQSFDQGRPIVVERAIYWNGRGAGTDTIGAFRE